MDLMIRRSVVCESTSVSGCSCQEGQSASIGETGPSFSHETLHLLVVLEVRVVRGSMEIDEYPA